MDAQESGTLRLLAVGIVGLEIGVGELAELHEYVIDRSTRHRRAERDGRSPRQVGVRSARTATMPRAGAADRQGR